MGWDRRRAGFEAGNFGTEGMDLGGQVGGDGDVASLLTLRGADQQRQGMDFGNEGHEVARLHLDAIVNCDFQGNEVDLWDIVLEVFILGVDVIMEVWSMRLMAGVCSLVEATSGVPDNGPALVWTRVEVAIGVGLAGVAELKEALSLPRKREKVPRLSRGSGQTSWRWKRGLAGSHRWGCLRKSVDLGTGTPGGRERSWQGRGFQSRRVLGSHGRRRSVVWTRR